MNVLKKVAMQSQVNEKEVEREISFAISTCFKGSKTSPTLKRLFPGKELPSAEDFVSVLSTEVLRLLAESELNYTA